jgi:hypothetical protein
MGFLARWLIGHLLRRHSRSRQVARRPAGFRGGRGYSSIGRGRGRRSRIGFRGPFPFYSTRTRGGSRVAVTGCCLPLALAPWAATIAAVALVRKMRR